ncbi:hypothetical protein DTO96_102405 [Ephemeroptericola cinctiostellae]|uniref:Phage portal protein n=1 Tax=Ephemeroptericola cinctiostellae TaxID=2268024 RepID=A0A345DE62_9BURK|nr:phage portal protein [Ephemeroptericola cinctiostellae]AXF86650.1 hypothetical protein DTO96_102405 [Ephemeroptericola cinctiostellae]
MSRRKINPKSARHAHAIQANSQYVEPPAPAHDASKSGRRLFNWRLGSSSAITELSAIGVARVRARDAYLNNPIARAVIDFMVSNLIGNGISPMPDFKDVTLRKKVIAVFESWSLDADLINGLDFYGMQTLIARTFLVAGECFIIHRLVETDSGVTYRVQAVEPEQVPFETRDLENGHSIVQGVEFDASGVRVAYWVRENLHDMSATTKRIEARFVSHVFKPMRPSQVRGVPFLANALVRLKQVDDFDDAVLERMKIANLFVGAIRRPDNYDEPAQTQMQPDAEYPMDDGDLPPLEMSPGAMLELGFGESIDFSNPPDAGMNYTEYMRWQYRTICAAFGVPYQVVMNDYADTNDRVMRVALNELSRSLTQLTENILVQKMCRPIRRWFFDQAILAGLLPSNKVEMRATRWIPQRKPYIHPVQDVQSLRLQNELGILPRSEISLQNGRDADSVDAQYKQDLEREQSLGLNFSSAHALLPSVDPGSNNSTAQNSGRTFFKARGIMPKTRSKK